MLVMTVRRYRSCCCYIGFFHEVDTTRHSRFAFSCAWIEASSIVRLLGGVLLRGLAVGFPLI